MTPRPAALLLTLAACDDTLLRPAEIPPAPDASVAPDAAPPPPCAPEGACYGADWWTATHPPCRPGVRICGACVAEVLPAEERCNGIDDDCDGETDEGLALAPVDLVLLVDRSGSMADDARCVARVIVAASERAGSRVWLGLVEANGDGSVRVARELGPVALGPGAAVDSGTREPILPALEGLALAVVLPDAPLALPIGWRADAKRIVLVLTDATLAELAGEPVPLERAQRLAAGAGLLVRVLSPSAGLDAIGERTPLEGAGESEIGTLLARACR